MLARVGVQHDAAAERVGWGNLADHEAVAGDHCSALGFARSQKEPTLIAQNMDLECFRDGSEERKILSETAKLCFSEAGTPLNVRINGWIG